MKNYTLPEKKKKLKSAITKALKLAHKEIKILGKKHYKEENLRYLVASEISKVNCFGNFPNLEESGPHLCFESHYIYRGLKKDSQLKPDIVSLLKTPTGKAYAVNSLLAVELKQNGSISGSAVNKGVNHADLKAQINKLGPCIESDIIKSRIYLTNKDLFTFDISAVIHLVAKAEEYEIVELNKMLNRQRKALRETNEITNKNLLFAWFNPLIKKPELIWLNQPNEIKLGRVK
jgi:hypothetical protein